MFLLTGRPKHTSFSFSGKWKCSFHIVANIYIFGDHRDLRTQRWFRCCVLVDSAFSQSVAGRKLRWWRPQSHFNPHSGCHQPLDSDRAVCTWVCMYLPVCVCACVLHWNLSGWSWNGFFFTWLLFPLMTEAVSWWEGSHVTDWNARERQLCRKSLLSAPSSVVFLCALIHLNQCHQQQSAIWSQQFFQ